ncbi:MAG: dihydropteroate synthase [Thermoplasmata archaeon]
MAFLMIGERLNVFASRRVRQALENRDEGAIIAMAREQVDAGAAALDVHAQSWEDMRWMLEAAGRAGVPLCLDSPDPEILRRGLEMPAVGFLNSVAGGRLELFELARERGVKVVGMLHDVTAEEVVEAARRAGFPLGNLYLDPAVMPVSLDASNARRLVERHRELKSRFPEIKTIVGISNATHGMPRPTEIRAVLLVTLMNDGLDAAILNPSELGWFVRAHSILADDGSGRSTVDYVRAYKREEAAKRSCSSRG